MQHSVLHHTANKDAEPFGPACLSTGHMSRSVYCRQKRKCGISFAVFKTKNLNVVAVLFRYEMVVFVTLHANNLFMYISRVLTCGPRACSNPYLFSFVRFPRTLVSYIFLV